MPKIEIYNVVKNNKTPKGPISVGDDMLSIRIKAASPIILIEEMSRLFLISSL